VKRRQRLARSSKQGMTGLGEFTRGLDCPHMADSGSPANWRFRPDADDGSPDSRHTKGNSGHPTLRGLGEVASRVLLRRSVEVIVGRIGNRCPGAEF
jgi:hypothetical protein